MQWGKAAVFLPSFPCLSLLPPACGAYGTNSETIFFLISSALSRTDLLSLDPCSSSIPTCYPHELTHGTREPCLKPRPRIPLRAPTSSSTVSTKGARLCPHWATRHVFEATAIALLCPWLWPSCLPSYPGTNMGPSGVISFPHPQPESLSKIHPNIGRRPLLLKCTHEIPLAPTCISFLPLR